MSHLPWTETDLAELDRAIRLARHYSRLRARMEELARLAREERRIERESAKAIPFRPDQSARDQRRLNKLNPWGRQ
jgi:hypothetical protein